MNTQPTPTVQTVYIVGPRNGSAYAALTLGILSVALIFIPILSSVMAITGVIIGGNAAAAAKTGRSTAGTAANWGIALSILNLIIWGGLWLIWQIGSSTQSTF